MKKVVLILAVIAVIFIYGCQKYAGQTQDTQKKAKTLSEMQATACETASEAGTCDTRLAELGIVLKEDCCEALGKCC